MNTQELIKCKNDGYYYDCEVIVYPNGNIEYAEPSHVKKMIYISGESEEVIYEKMPIYSAPIEWMVEYTGCVAVWDSFCLTPKQCTKEQVDTIVELIHSGLTRNIVINRLNDIEMESIVAARNYKH